MKFNLNNKISLTLEFHKTLNNKSGFDHRNIKPTNEDTVMRPILAFKSVVRIKKRSFEDVRL